MPAEQATGDVKALSAGSPLASLVLRALALRAEPPLCRATGQGSGPPS
jgi:hypothetical protein